MFHTLLSMITTGFLYSCAMGYPLGVGFLLIFFVHESGHAMMIKLMGLRIKAMIFLPGLAFVSLKDQPRSLWVESIIGIGGPLFGCIGGVIALVAGMYFTTGYWSQLLIVLAWISFTTDLFCLLPLRPLDGRRITQHFKPWYWIPGCLLMAAMAYFSLYVTGNAHPLVMYILLLGVMHGVAGFCHHLFHSKRLIDRLKRKPNRAWDNSKITPNQRRLVALSYFGLCAILLVLAIFAGQHKPPVDAELAKIRAIQFY